MSPMNGEEKIRADLEVALSQRVNSVRPIPEGHSGFTYFVDGDYVLRLPPPGARIAGPADVVRQGRIMSALRGAGLPTPAIRMMSSDPSVDGRPFILMERVDGVRIEATAESFLGNHVFSNGSKYLTTVPVTGNHDYIDVLPSVQLQYSFGANKIRAAYGMGIARPNFADLPPFITEDDKKNTVKVGNPALRPTRANNYDILFERYLKPAGVIQFGAFYKDLRNPIYENVETDITTGTFAGFQQFQAINGPRAHITGIEMTWQQHLSFLPGPMNCLKVSLR